MRPESARFTYDTRTAWVSFGEGALADLAAALERVGARRVLVLTTAGRADVAAEIVRSLGDASIGRFARAMPHVPRDIVDEALDEVERTRADGYVAIGGGSAIGLGKALALETDRPLVAVPTTYSGSEMTRIWGITDDDRKATGRDARVAPRAVIYEPALTTSLPPAASAASGMNAIAHCVEALYAENAHPVASLIAEEGIRGLARSLPIIVHEPEDIAARADALLGAHLGGSVLDMTSMGLHHRLCHVLGGAFGLPHALTHAVMLPHVAAYNAPVAAVAMAAIANALGAEDAWTGLSDLNRTLGITSTLRDLGLAPSDLDRAAELVTASEYPNPREVTQDRVRALLEAAYAGALAGI